MLLVTIALAWVAGVLMSANGHVDVPLVWGIFVVLTLIPFAMLWRTEQRMLGVWLVVLMLGGWRASLMPDTSPLMAYHGVGGLTLTGTVVDEPDRRDTGTRIIIETTNLIRGAETRPMSGRVLVEVPREAVVACGDRVQVGGSLETPGVYDTFSYADYLAAQDVFSVMRGARVEVLAAGVSCWPMRTLHRWKDTLQLTINRMMPEPQAGLLVGILLGNERGLSPNLQDAFAATGAAHIIAISGFNMAILAGVVSGGLRRLNVPAWLVAILALLVLGLYTLLVGANPAVVRAAVMSSVVIVGESLKRRSYVPASLAFVALVMSVLSPRVLWSVSFQLSFFATLGLALFARPFGRWFERGLQALLPRMWASRVAGFLGEPIVVTAAALVMTLPLTTLYFQRVSLVQFAVNLLVVPVQSWVLIVGLIATGTALIWPALGQLLYWVVMALLWWTVAVVRWFAALPFAQAVLYVDARLVWLFFVGVVGGAIVQAIQPTWAMRLLRWARARLVWTTAVWVGMVMVGLNVALVRTRPDGLLHLYALDVGHSHGVFIETPGGAQILIDGGRYPSRLLTQIGERMPFNDRHIELVVMTQPDVLDYEAQSAVFERYTVGAVLTHGQPNLSEPFAAWQAAAADFTQQAVQAGYTVEMDDGTRIEVLYPDDTPQLGDDLSDSSLVLRISYGDVAYLITGDVSIGGQQSLLAAGAWPLAEVMLLPSHAGQRSLDEDFLAAVQPSVFVLQSDKANRRGDPDPDTLALLDETLPLLRTDTQGVVHVWTDGAQLWTSPPR